MIWTILATVAITFLGVIVFRLLTTPARRIDYHIESACRVGDDQFRRVMGNLLGAQIVTGNRITPFRNGAEFFPAMISAIRGARHTITMETFIYWEGAIGKSFAEALAQRAQAGVRVHVLIDSFGSFKIDNQYIKMMKEAGVEVEWYRPLRWWSIHRANHRTHRKILVVDGNAAFTGGAGIADEWDGGAEQSDHWRDNHYLLEGPAVGQMQAAFMDNWIKTRADVLHDDCYFPEIGPLGPSDAQVFKSSPREGSESMRLMYLFAIASARRRILVASAYFVPDEHSIKSFIAARKRGVEVVIMMPGEKLDTQLTRRASRATWGPMLEAGVELHEFQPCRMHTKVMIIDDVWVSVGSTNFDNRSFRLNDEANLNVLDPEFALREARAFEDDLRNCRRVTMDRWSRRPLHKKILDHATSLLRPQL